MDCELDCELDCKVKLPAADCELELKAAETPLVDDEADPETIICEAEVD